MSQPQSSKVSVPNAADFPDALRFWRGVRRFSQMQLALEAQVSVKHVAHLETAKTRPSRAMVLHLSEALLLPREARNHLLSLAGFAPAYPSGPLTSDALAPLEAALRDMMDKHAPWPALLCDRAWNVLRTNPAADLLLETLGGSATGCNVIELLCKSSRVPEVVLNLDEVLWEMLGRVRLELLDVGQDTSLARLEDMLKAAVPASHPSEHQPRRPLVPFRVRFLGQELSFLTAIAHFGTSEDIAVRDLRLELLFPADAATRAMLG